MDASGGRARRGRQGCGGRRRGSLAHRLEDDDHDGDEEQTEREPGRVLVLDEDTAERAEVKGSREHGSRAEEDGRADTRAGEPTQPERRVVPERPREHACTRDQDDGRATRGQDERQTHEHHGDTGDNQ